MINATAGLARQTSRHVHRSTERYFVVSVFNYIGNKIHERIHAGLQVKVVKLQEF